MNTLFQGSDTGRVDAEGKAIRCGDRVSYYERKRPYTETSTENGYGQDRPLPPEQWRKHSAREKTILGVVVYDEALTAFVVKFEQTLLESGHRQEFLYMLLSQPHASFLAAGDQKRLSVLA